MRASLRTERPLIPQLGMPMELVEHMRDVSVIEPKVLKVLHPEKPLAKLTMS